MNANGKSITSILGGGNQGHLHLVTSEATYSRINTTSIFARPNHSGPLKNINGATQFQIDEACRIHDKQFQAFSIYNLSEHTKIQ